MVLHDIFASINTCDVLHCGIAYMLLTLLFLLTLHNLCQTVNEGYYRVNRKRFQIQCECYVTCVKVNLSVCDIKNNSHMGAAPELSVDHCCDLQIT